MKYLQRVIQSMHKRNKITSNSVGYSSFFKDDSNTWSPMAIRSMQSSHPRCFIII
jgi:hypothetical protein